MLANGAPLVVDDYYDLFANFLETHCYYSFLYRPFRCHRRLLSHPHQRLGIWNKHLFIAIFFSYLFQGWKSSSRKNYRLSTYLIQFLSRIRTETK